MQHWSRFIRRTSRAWCGRAIAGLACIGSLIGHATAQTPAGRAHGDGEVRLLSPSLGRPAIVEPGETFEVVAFAEGSPSKRISVRLVRERWPSVELSLPVAPDFASSLTEGAPARLRVPPEAPPGIYDLRLDVDGRTVIAPHSVSVRTVGKRIRLVHLSDMNIGSLAAPEFDPRLAAEVNLLGADLIVATGDIIDVTHPNPERGWREFVRFAQLFDAPLVVACGDHDLIDLYSRFVAPSPVGDLRVGPCRIILLNDHIRSPLVGDAEQVRWADRIVASSGDAPIVFAVHASRPNLFAIWRQRGALRENLSRAAACLWVAGGAEDWDGVAWRDLMAAAGNVGYVATGQASGALLGGRGAMRYRIVDLHLAESASGAKPHFEIHEPMDAGSLSCSTDVSNDGAATRMAVWARNGSAVAIDGMMKRVYLAKADVPPWSQGAQIERVVDHGRFWEAWLRIDVPDRAAARVIVGTDEPPASPPWAVRIEAPGTLDLEPRTTGEGVSYGRGPTGTVTIEITNHGKQPAVTTPIIKLAGRRLAYRTGDDGRGSLVLLRRMRIEPNQTVRLRPDLSAIRVAPGPCTLQTYLLGSDVVVPHSRKVVVRVGD
ncbi:MAG: hypothetical protein D6744_05095 [Planctomycetota bacterium]|nr:MAG: hypothetical protein D6744_05095 [Planctomycetota bacterium]